MTKFAQWRKQWINFYLLAEYIIAEGESTAFQAGPWDARADQIFFEPCGTETWTVIDIEIRIDLTDKSFL